MSAQFATAKTAALARAPFTARQSSVRRASIVRAGGSATQQKGLGDLDTVELKAADGSAATVYLFGGVVTSFKPKGGDDVLYVRPDAKFDKSKPVRAPMRSSPRSRAQMLFYARVLLLSPRARTDRSASFDR